MHRTCTHPGIHIAEWACASDNSLLTPFTTGELRCEQDNSGVTHLVEAAESLLRPNLLERIHRARVLRRLPGNGHLRLQTHLGRVQRVPGGYL